MRAGASRRPARGPVARVEPLPGLRLELRLEADGTLVVTLAPGAIVRALRLEAPRIEVEAPGGLTLSGGRVVAESRGHLELRAEGQVRLWGEDGVEDGE